MVTATAPFEPAGSPPPGVVPNYENPEDISGQVFEAGYACTIIALLLVIMRFYTRVWITKSTGLDDYLIYFSMAGSVVFMALTFKSCDLGVGVHIWEVPLEDYSPWFLIYNVASSSVYMVAICVAKLSIAVFFLRLNPERNFKFVVYGICGFIITYGTVNTVMVIFSCSPVKALWDFNVKNPKCINRNLVLLVLSIFNIFTDFLVLLLPIRIVLPLSMPRRQKVGLIGIFMSGTFVCVVAVVRTVLLDRFTGNPDATYSVAEQFVWSFIEINVGICCACLPHLKPFFRQHIPFLLSAGRSRHGNSSYGGTKNIRSQSYRLESFRDGASANDVGQNRNTVVAGNSSTESIYGKGEDLKYKSATDLPHGHRRDRNILRTTEVNVEYEFNTIREAMV